MMDSNCAIDRQRAFFRTGATRPLEFRGVQLRKFGHAIETHERALFDALHADLRKSPHQAYTTEIGLVLAEIQHARRHLWA